MRGWVGVAMLLAGVLLFSGNAAAHPSVLDITVDDDEASRETRFNKDACLPQCPIGSTEVGYLGPVTIVPSGATVTWESTDNVYHLNREYNAMGPANPPESCISVGIWPGGLGEATFEIHSDGLWGQDVGDDFEPCTYAQALPDGSYLFPYFCAAHGAPQNGFLLVQPAEA